MHCRINRVPRGAGDIRNNRPLFSRHGIDQRGFSRVRPADDRHPDFLTLLIFRLSRRQVLKNGIQQIAGSLSMHRGHRDRVTETQVIKLVKFGRHLAHPVALIHAKHHRFAAALQQGRHICVVRGHAIGHAGYQHDDVRLLDRQLCLPAHLRQNDVVAVRLDAAGIGKHKGTPPPFAGRKYPVARDARRIFDYGKPLADQPVE